MLIKSRIRAIPDWPKKGIIFRDITTLLKDPVGLKLCLDDFIERYKNIDIDVIAGIDSRGFILGGALAYELGKGFVPIRKKGKLPAEVESEEYELEYGTDTIEIHKDAINQGQKVLIIDDLIATGGTALAAAKLVEKLGGQVVELAFIVDLPDLGGDVNIVTPSNGITPSMTHFRGSNFILQISGTLSTPSRVGSNSIRLGFFLPIHTNPFCYCTEQMRLHSQCVIK